MDSDNGGWTIIQHRVANGTENFYKGWDDYELGFGNLEEEFWFGLQNIHRLTTRDDVELRIDLQDEQGDNATWTYQEFKVDGPADKYRLRIGPGTGPPGNRDSMAHHNNQPFTTYDRDNDNHSRNCANMSHGAWWYNRCYNSNLNGPHELYGSSQLVWLVGGTGSSGGQFEYFPNVEMKVRPKTCILKEDC